MPTRYSPGLAAGSGFAQGFSGVITQALVDQAKQKSEQEAAFTTTIVNAAMENHDLLDHPEVQKILQSRLGKEQSAVLSDVLKAIGPDVFKSASRDEQARFRGMTTPPPEGGPVVSPAQALGSMTPSQAALTIGDKKGYLQAREKEAAPARGAQGLPGLYAALDDAKAKGNWQLVAGLANEIHNKELPAEDRAALNAKAVAAAVEPFKERQLTAREASQKRQFEARLKTKSKGPIPPGLAPHYQMADGSPLPPDISVEALAAGIRDRSIEPATGIGAALHSLLATLAPGGKKAATSTPAPGPAPAELGIDWGEDFKIKPAP